MCPILIDFGEITLFGWTVHLALPGYGALVALAVIAGWLWVLKLLQPLTPRAPMTDIYFLSLVAGFAGAKGLNALTRMDEILSGRLDLIDVLQGGGVWLGGALAGIVVAFTLFRLHHVPVGLAANVVFIGVPFTHAIGRIGCLLGGCCYGRPSDLPWALTFHSELAHRTMGTPLGTALHPTQLYEFVAEMLNWAVGFFMWRRKARPWSICFTWFALYGAERIVIEGFRGDKIRGYVGFLSTSQWISLGMVALALVGFVLVLRGRVFDGGRGWDAEIAASEARAARAEKERGRKKA